MILIKLCRYFGFGFSGYALSSFVQLEESPERILGIALCVFVIASALVTFYFVDKKNAQPSDACPRNYWGYIRRRLLSKENA